jgi:glycosyltransferase involved in cell wall biosynthesis
MKILICCERYYPSVGGVQEVVQQVSEQLVLQGHDVTVATTYLFERTEFVNKGVSIRQFKVAGNLVRGMQGELEEYRSFVTNFDGDALLVKAAQQWTFDALWPILDQIRLYKVFIPCGFSAFYDPEYATYFAKLAHLIFKWDHLIFYSDSYRDIDFVRSLGYKNTTVLPNGSSGEQFAAPLDPQRLAHLSIKDADVVLITVGTLSPMKGQLQILRAFEKIKTSGKSIILIVNAQNPSKSPVWTPVWSEAPLVKQGGYLTKSIRKVKRLTALAQKAWIYLKQHNFPNLCFYVGTYVYKRTVSSKKSYVDEVNKLIKKFEHDPLKKVMLVDLPRDQLIQAYMRADLFLFVSKIECSPLVLYESAAAGTPFLSVPVGNASEIASWTGAGLIISQATTDARGFTEVTDQSLVEAIDQAIVDPKLMRDLGAQGYERTRKYFTWEKIAPHYAEILAGVPCTIQNFRI